MEKAEGWGRQVLTQSLRGGGRGRAGGMRDYGPRPQGDEGT